MNKRLAEIIVIGVFGLVALAMITQCRANEVNHGCAVWSPCKWQASGEAR